MKRIIEFLNRVWRTDAYLLPGHSRRTIKQAWFESGVVIDARRRIKSRRMT